jgi:cobalt/nickel transport system permease protein
VSLRKRARGAGFPAVGADDLLSPYRHGGSVIHRLPAEIKLAAAVAFVLAIALAPSPAWAVYGAGAAMLLLVVVATRIPLLHLGRRLLLVEPLIVGIAALSLLQPAGAQVFAAMLARGTLCLCCMLLLSSTTRFSDTLRVARAVRVPGLLVTTLALMHRYLFLLVDETGRMRRARRSRTYTSGILPIWQGLASTIAHLFVRSSERAERIYAAMCARGWRT